MTTTKTRATRFHIDSSERLPSGALRVRGNLTKTGVFPYQFGDTLVRELRSEKEVFSASAMDSLVGVPVTVDHPAGFVDNANHAILAVGTVTKVEEAPPYISGEMRIHDERTIAMIESKKLVEVSLGYATDVVPHTDSDIADMVQTNIIYNHAALGPQGWGRLGSDVALRLDKDGDLDFSAFRMDVADTLDPRWTQVVNNLTALLKRL
jgi:hypothetical protein